MAKPIRDPSITASHLNERAQGSLIQWMDINIEKVGDGILVSSMKISSSHMAPNGFLHAGSIVTLADFSCGCATIAHLPKRAKSFATIELKCNFLGTAKNGSLICTAKNQHWGKTTQVWDASISKKNSDLIIGLFRCTEIILGDH